MWLGIIAAVTEVIKIIGQLVPWFLSLDSEMRKEVRTAWDNLMKAEKDGKRADIRSSINRLNSTLPS